MSTSYLIVCETHIDMNILERAISQVFIDDTILTNESISTHVRSNHNNTEAQSAMYHGKIQSIHFEDKDDYRAKEAALYQVYESHHLLFLGNVTDYSIPLQEGMLRLIEEPPQNLSVVMFCHDIIDILPTIVSRCRVIRLSRECVMQLLEQDHMNFIKKNFPPVKEFINDWLRNAPTEFKLNPKASREHIDSWLWQIGCYLDAMYSKTISMSVAQAIEHIGYARRLNRDNVQKKFVIESLFV